LLFKPWIDIASHFILSNKMIKSRMDELGEATAKLIETSDGVLHPADEDVFASNPSEWHPRQLQQSSENSTS
jgi:hypothetical protein